MHRPLQQTIGRSAGPRGQRAQVAQHQGGIIRLRRGGFHRPAHVIAEHLDLIDCLVGPAAAQLRRPVGRQHQQRDVSVVGLNDGRMEVGRGRARRANQRHRPFRGLGQAQGKEARAAFIQVAINPHRRLRGKGQRQRRRAGAGGDAHCLQAAAGQLFDEDRHPPGIGVRAQVHLTAPPRHPARPASAEISAPSPPTPAPAGSRERCPPRRRARRDRAG